MFITHLLLIVVAESVLPEIEAAQKLSRFFCLIYVYTFLARNSKKVLR